MKLRKSLSILLLASILITTLFSYPVFSDTIPTVTIKESGNIVDTVSVE